MFGSQETPVIGKSALPFVTSHPGQVIYSVKRFMGCTFRDERVRTDQAQVTYTIEEVQQSKVAVSIGEQIFTPSQVSARVLYHAQRKAVRFKDADFVDLYDFIKVLQDKYAGDSNELTKIIDEIIDLMLIEAESQVILANATLGVRFERVKGLSIYSPLRGYSQFYKRSDFADCGWGEFLRVHNSID